MIEKILKLENLGLLQNATQSGAVVISQTTAIYAENGRGKSTLAAALRACQRQDATRLTARKTIDGSADPKISLLSTSGAQFSFAGGSWSGRLPNLVVFDSEFVEENVYSGFEVRPDQRQSLLEFALGEQTVHLKQQLEKITQDISQQTAIKTQIENELVRIAAPYTFSQFCSLPTLVDPVQQAEDLAKRIAAVKSSQPLLARKNPNALTAIEFEISSVFQTLAKTLENIDVEAERQVKAHLVRHEYEEFEDWLGKGVAFAEGTHCPFCAQDVAGIELVGAYRSYFNQSYKQLKTQIEKLEELIASGLSDSKISTAVAAAEANAARIEAWKDQMDLAVPQLDQTSLLHAIDELRKQLTALSLRKAHAALSAIGCEQDENDALSLLARINTVLSTYNAELQAVVVSIDAYKTKLATEQLIALETQLKKIGVAIRRHTAPVDARVVEYRNADSAKRRLEADKAKAREELDKHMLATLGGLEASINQHLDTFGAEFTIEQFKPNYAGGDPRCEYGIRMRNRSVKVGARTGSTTGHVFATTLSEADKRTLAFAFFVARLKSDAQLNKQIVVIDDPVSSMDRNRRHQTVKLLTALASECQQLIVLSHDAYFLRELRDKLGLKQTPIVPTVLTIIRVQGGYSAFSACEIDDVCSSDYYRHHQLVSAYVDGKSGSNIRDVAKAIRPLLEGYYHRRFPGLIPKRMMFGQVINHAAMASAGNPLQNLGPILPLMRDVNDYASQFHHDTNPGFETVPVTDAELLKHAKDAPELIYHNG